MFKAMPRVFAIAVFLTAALHSSNASAASRQSSIIPTEARRNSSRAPHGLPASSSHSLQMKSGAKPLISKTIPLGSAASAPALKNFPGVQNADIVIPGHAVGDSAWVEASLTVDVDGDGHPDVVTAQFDGTLNVMLNPGPGTTGEWQRKTNKSAIFPGSVYNGAGIDYMYSADLNGDKLPDIITVSYLARTIYVYLNGGQGEFENAASYQLPFHFGGPLAPSGGLAIGDLDGDGFPDIVALGVQTFFPDSSSSAMEALTLMNAKDGTFAAAQAGDVSVQPGYLGATYSAIKLADMNGDGQPDLVFVGGEAFSSTLFLAVAPGTAGHLFNNPLPSIPISQITGYGIPDQTLGGLVLKDLDGDGNVDALFQTGSNVFLAKGQSGGGFAPPASVLASLSAPESSTFADMNGDGILDVVVYANAVTSIYSGIDNGQFSTSPTQIPGGARSTQGVGDRQVPEPADIDGDGKLDLIGLDTDTGEIGINLNSATGFHTPQVLVPDPSIYNGMFSAGIGAIKAAGSRDLVTIAAVNGGSYENSPPILAITNDGAGNFPSSAYHTLLTTDQATNIHALLSSKAVAAIADVDGDGLSDLLLTTGANGDEVIGGGLAVSMNKGNYVFTDPIRLTTQEFGLSCDLERTAVGDLNHDQKPDFVTAYRGNACSNAQSYPGLPSGFITYISQPDGSYKSAFFGYGQYSFLPVLADVDGDGNLDLILGESDGYSLSGVTVLPGKGDGSFNLAAAVSVLPRSYLISSITAGDVDGDGKQDLAVGVLAQLDSSGAPVDNTTGLLMMKGGGDFTFAKGTWYLTGSQVWASRLGDLDGDGLPDLALNVTTAAASGYSSSTDGAVAEPGLVLLPNLGAGIFGTPLAVFGTTSDIGVSIPSPPVDGSLQLADLNGDGALDVLNDNAYEPNVYLNVGAVKFTLAISSSTITQGSSLTLTAELQPTVSQKTAGGAVSFFANGTLIGTASLQNQAASLETAALAPGSYSITALYSGDANFNQASASAPVAVAVSPLTPDFSLTAPTPASLSLAAGQAGEVTFTLTGNATFSGTITLNCTGAGAGMQCLVSQPSLVLAPGQATTVSMAITTRGSSSAAAHDAIPGWKHLTGGVSLASVFLFALLGARRKKLSSWCFPLFFSVLVSLGASGCSGGSSTTPIQPNNSTPAGNYSLVISASGGASMHSQVVPVSVH